MSPRPTGRGPREALAQFVDLVVPLECAGCTRPREVLCATCAEYFAGAPMPVRLPAGPPVPVWTTGRYGGPAARAVNAYKDRGRGDLAEVFGRILARTVEGLRETGDLPDDDLAPLVFVPVPASRSARRRRGADHVRSFVAAAAADLAGGTPPSRVAIADLLAVRGRRRDSAGLGAAQRAANIAGTVVRRGPRPFVATPGAPRDLEQLVTTPAAVVLVDDIATTGATLAECESVLAAGGVRISGAVALLAA